MRGDMAQACSILVAARQALRAGTSLVYDPQLYVNSTSFRFRERKWFGRTKTYSVGSVSEWFERCRTQGLVDLQYLTPTKPDNRDSLAFANSSPNFLVCFFRHGRVRLLGVRMVVRFPIRWMGCRLRGESRSRNIQTEIAVGEQC